MRNLEKQLKALANRRRLQIIKFLDSSSFATVTEIAKEIRLSFRSTSRHLAVLLSMDIVDRDQLSTNALYKLHRPMAEPVKLVVRLL